MPKYHHGKLNEKTNVKNFSRTNFTKLGYNIETEMSKIVRSTRKNARRHVLRKIQKIAENKIYYFVKRLGLIPLICV